MNRYSQQTKDKYKNPLKEYWLICKDVDSSYDYHILAINSDWALTFVSKDWDWDEIILRKMSNKVVGFASYGARDISNENPEQYLHHHCIPNEE